MSEQAATKVRSAKQAAENDKLRAAVAELKAAGLKAGVPYPRKFITKMAAGDKTKEEVIEEIRVEQAAPAAPKIKKATAATSSAAAAAAAASTNNGTRNNKPNNAAATKKVKSAAKMAANQKLRNDAAWFKRHNIKWEGPSYKFYKNAKKATENRPAMTNDELIPIMKEKFPKFKVTNTGDKVAVVTKRAVTKKANAAKAANVVAPANTGATKGQYVCDRCRLVANNTRKNNKPKNANVNAASPKATAAEGSNASASPKLTAAEGSNPSASSGANNLRELFGLNE